MALAVRIIGVLLVALGAGCSGVYEKPLSVTAQSGPLSVDPSLLGSNQARAVAAEPTRSQPKEEALDVAALKARLRDANTIGALTKLVLKDQVNELLNRFRAHYQRGQKTGAADLRQPYDMLVFKMLALVQDRDPSLARTISGSREAIWSILADPDKFSLAT